MRFLYEVLRALLTQHGYDIAPFHENTFETDDRNLAIDIESINEFMPLFGIYEATVSFYFLDDTWEDNAAKLSDIIMTLIPVENRPDDDECRFMADNSDMVEVLDVPEWSNVMVEIDPDNSDEVHKVTALIKYRI